MIYQILGWPRSRTAWLANYLTYQNSFCFHEGVGNLEQKRLRTVEEYRKLFAKFLGKFDHVGDANTITLAKQKYVLPEARVVIIERDKEEIKKSLGKIQLHADIPKVIEYPYNECLIVKYKDINARLGDIWDFCLPGVKRNLARELILKRFNIQVQNPYDYVNFRGV